MKGVEHTFSVFKEYEKAVIYLSNNKLTMFTSLFSVVCLSLTMLLLIAFIVTLHLHIHVLNVLDSSVASHILEHGFYSLFNAYKTAFPHLNFRSQNALHRCIHMPLAGVCVGTPHSVTCAWYLLEYIDVNYIQVVQLSTVRQAGNEK